MFSKNSTKRKDRSQARAKLREEMKDYKLWRRKFKRAIRNVNYAKVDNLIDVAVYYGYKIPGLESNYILRQMKEKHTKLQEKQKAMEESE